MKNVHRRHESEAADIFRGSFLARDLLPSLCYLQRPHRQNQVQVQQTWSGISLLGRGRLTCPNLIMASSSVPFLHRSLGFPDFHVIRLLPFPSIYSTAVIPYIPRFIPKPPRARTHHPSHQPTSENMSHEKGSLGIASAKVRHNFPTVYSTPNLPKKK
jgi:hypothetical protein